MPGLSESSGLHVGDGLNWLDGGLGGAGLTAGGFSPFAVAIFNAFTTPPTAARKTAIDTAVKALVSGDVWDNFDVLHVYAAADSQAAAINWKNPGTFTASPIALTTFTADRGFTGNGTTTYVDTTFNPTTASSPKFVQNSAHMGVWVLTARAGADMADIGMTTVAGTNLYPRFTDNNAYLRLNDSVETGGFAVTTSNGFYLANRSGASSREGYKDGASIGTYAASASAAPLNQNIVVCNGGGVGAHLSTDQCAAACVGSSLNSTQQLALYNALLAYMQAVGAVP